MQTLKQPTSQLTEVLYLLLERDRTSLDIIWNGVLSPTSKISQLRKKGVIILCNNIDKVNKFGRNIQYGSFQIMNREDAIKIYNNLNG